MNWYAIRVAVNTERRVAKRLKRLAANLAARLYLPICESKALLDLHRSEIDKDGNEVVVLAGEVQPVQGLVVPGYVFIRVAMTEDIAARIVSIAGARYIMPSSLRPLPIDESVIDGMRYECERLIRSTNDVPDLDWMLGKMFKVTEGAHADRFGPCLSFARDGRPQIAIETFKGRYQALPFALDSLVLTTDEDAYMAEVARLNQKTRARRKREQRRARVA